MYNFRVQVGCKLKLHQIRKTATLKDCKRQIKGYSYANCSCVRYLNCIHVDKCKNVWMKMNIFIVQMMDWNCFEYISAFLTRIYSKLVKNISCIVIFIHTFSNCVSPCDLYFSPLLRPDFVALKVAEKIAENNNDACLIMVSKIPLFICLFCSDGASKLENFRGWVKKNGLLKVQI